MWCVTGSGCCRRRANLSDAENVSKTDIKMSLLRVANVKRRILGEISNNPSPRARGVGFHSVYDPYGRPRWFSW